MEEVKDISIHQDFDVFFYYGQNDLPLETRSDVLANILQPKRSLFYNRSLDSAGVSAYENSPVGLTMRVNLPYDVVSSLSRRNQFVSNGENGTRDRRVAVSQSTVRIVARDNGNVDITVLYIPLADFNQTENLQVGLTSIPGV